MITIRTFSSNGPYFPPTQGVYQASSLKEMIFHIRQSMEDGEYQIGLFDAEGECKGIWTDEAEPEPERNTQCSDGTMQSMVPNGEGGWHNTKPFYVLHRPGTMSKAMWRLHLSKFKRV
jgi:hypothetical protein